MSSATMPAAVLLRHGAPPEHRQYFVPSRHAGQALVRVTAAPISPLDLLCASGRSYFGPPQLPYVPGVQGVGTIVESDQEIVFGELIDDEPVTPAILTDSTNQ